MAIPRMDRKTRAIFRRLISANPHHTVGAAEVLAYKASGSKKPADIFEYQLRKKQSAKFSGR